MRTTLREGAIVETRKQRPGAVHAWPSRAGPQKRSRASGKVAPNARLDCSPCTTCSGRLTTSSSEPLSSIGPSCTITSVGPRCRASASAMGRVERARAKWTIPSPAIGRKAIIAASATPMPAAGQRRSVATAIATAASPNTRPPSSMIGA